MFADGFTDEELQEELLTCEATRRCLDARQARIEAELAARGCCDRDHGLVTGSWLAARTGLASGKCRYRVKLSTKLVRFLPRVLAALDAGLISFEHARVIAEATNERNLDLVGLIQDDLVACAQGCVFSRWRNEVTALCAVLDTDGGFDPSRDRGSELHLSTGLDTTVYLNATLSAEDAVTISNEIHRVSDELYRQAVKDHNTCPELDVPSPAQLRVKALAEICRRSAARNLDESVPPRTEAIVILNPATGDATTTNGTPLNAETFTRMCPDPVWRALHVDEHGVPLDLGRTQRLASPHQRAALAVRDGGCVFPGCDTPVCWTVAHHVQHWENDGRSDLANLVLLCRHHHGVTHRNHWTMTPDTGNDQTFTWTTPTGRTIHSQQHHHQRKLQPQPA